MVDAMEDAESNPEAEVRPPYLVKEIAMMLRVSQATVYEEIASGRLSALSIGEGSGAKRIEHEAFVAYKAECRLRAVRESEIAPSEEVA